VSSLDSNVALLVAALDLKLVQLIRDAIRVTDLAGATERGGSIGPEPTIEPRRHYEPTPVFEPRQHIHPAPIYERPRVIARGVAPACRVEPPVTPGEPAVCPMECAPPAPPFMQPPWKTLPWENSAQPAVKVKVVKIKPDIVRKGSLVDLFL
jgi:hypothetical protein